jgi:metallo-beta-lactamase superfamily protein
MLPCGKRCRYRCIVCAIAFPAFAGNACITSSHEHLDHVGAAHHFGGHGTIIAAHRLAANKIMLRDDFSMLRKMFNDIDLWLEEGNLIDLGNFRLNVMYTPGHTSVRDLNKLDDA